MQNVTHELAILEKCANEIESALTRTQPLMDSLREAWQAMQAREYAEAACYEGRTDMAARL